MANVIDMLVWIFAVVGLLTLVGIALYYIAKALEKYKPPAEPIWPDERYMEKVGALCPTGWVYRGKSDNGGNLCQNYYQVNVNNDDCYNVDPKQRLASFPVIKDWQKCQDDPGNCNALKKRCRWIKKCGPKVQSRDPTRCDAQGSWTDESEFCKHTSFGCCPGTQTPKVDKEGSNCDSYENPFASWIGVSNKC